MKISAERIPGLVLLIVALIFTGVSLDAQIPRIISYQGVAASGETALSDGQHLFRFRIYTAESGGTPLFDETQSLMVTGGLFSAGIGSATPIPTSVLFDRDYYLGIAIDGKPELSPRTPLTTSPYAFRAERTSTAARATIADSLSPSFTGLVRSINGNVGHLQLAGEQGVSVRSDGQKVTIGYQGSSGGGISQVTSPDSSITVVNPAGPTVELTLPQKRFPASRIDTTGATAGQFLGFDGTTVGFLDLPEIEFDTAGASAGQLLGFDGDSIIFLDPPAGFSLPFADTAGATTPLFSIVDTGGKGAALLGIDNGSSSDYALHLFSNGDGSALRVERTKSSGTSPSVYATISSTSNGSGITSGATGLQGEVLGTSAGGWSAGVRGINNSTTGNGIGVVGYQAGSGWGVVGQTAGGTGVRAVTGEGGNALVAIYNGTNQSSTTADNIAIFQAPPRTGGAAVNQARISSSGTGYFNGGTVNSGADVAELFDVMPSPGGYEPGDVLAISTDADRTLSLSSHPYSTLVVGVYATKPGVLLTEEHIDSTREEMVPLGIIGVIPTKVCDENGPISRGDILVTSSRPGHAMRADPEVAARYPGAVIGKALENFTANGTGEIRVLVNVR